MAEDGWCGVGVFVASMGAAVHHHLRVQNTLTHGHAVLATHPIPKGDTLLRVPLQACILPPQCANNSTQLTSPLATVQKTLSPWLALVIELMHHLCNPASPWRTYLDTLPHEFDMPNHWDEEDLKHLRGTSVELLLAGNSLQEQFRTVVQPLLRDHPDLWPPETATFEVFQRAVALVRSRGYHEGQGALGPFMIPLVDMLNHSLAKKCTTLQREGDYFVMRAERDIEEGEQLFTTYGDLSNAQLLHTYGTDLSFCLTVERVH